MGNVTCYLSALTMGSTTACVACWLLTVKSFSRNCPPCPHSRSCLFPHVSLYLMTGCGGTIKAQPTCSKLWQPFRGLKSYLSMNSSHAVWGEALGWKSEGSGSKPFLPIVVSGLVEWHRLSNLTFVSTNGDSNDNNNSNYHNYLWRFSKSLKTTDHKKYW